ncbi:hypothetical protein [Nocardioides alcanivorans]|uniref:hypothetical protein n=1 Tax=Nocardioides alcanivorans TaxID=2897352 RepID=UPI001F234168|nr:hypothetical protein [Nocardioides alcanivorans]
MTWQTFHRRGDVLRAIVSEANLRCDGTIPDDVPGVRESFDDDLDLIGALQLRWHTALAGHLESALDAEPHDLGAAVVRGWRETADLLPGVRAILDARRAEPGSAPIAAAMLTATAKEHQMLALMAGRASRLDVEERGARVGAQIEQAAREGHALRAHVTPGKSLLSRLRAHLVA